MFKKIKRAYETLVDPQKRQMYDMTGSVDGEDSGGGGGGGGGMTGGFPFDIGSIFGGMGGLGGIGGLGSMFGMGAGGGLPRQRHRRQKGPPKVHDIPLRIQDFFKGRTLHVKFDRQKFCAGCKGEGASSFQSCGGCGGRGIVHRMMMMGPMQVMSEGPCPQCGARGKIPKEACNQCHGKKFFNQEKTLEVRIEPGMKAGDTLVFPSECSDHPDFDEAGDVHFILQEADETTLWSRKGDDLHTVVRIGLADSLLGCVKSIPQHPAFEGEETFQIQIPAGTQNGETVRAVGQGIPKRNSDGARGDVCAVVQIEVNQKDREVLERNQVLFRSMFRAA